MDIARRAALATAFTVAWGLAGCAEDTSPPRTSTARSTATAVAVDNAAARRFVDAVNSGSTEHPFTTRGDFVAELILG
jgi:hypothetical protein